MEMRRVTFNLENLWIVHLPTIFMKINALSKSATAKNSQIEIKNLNYALVNHIFFLSAPQSPSNLFHNKNSLRVFMQLGFLFPSFHIHFASFLFNRIPLQMSFTAKTSADFSPAFPLHSFVFMGINLFALLQKISSFSLLLHRC